MSLTATVRQKPNAKTPSPDGNDPFQDKRRLLSYWKSLDSPRTPDKEDGEIGAKDELLEEFKKSLIEMDDCVSEVVSAEEGTHHLQNEQLSLLKQLGDYVQHLFKERSDLDPNDNLNNEEDESEHLDSLKAERQLLLEENEKLVNQLETQNYEYQSSSKEKQRDIEKLTREVQNFNILRRKLERELLHATELRDEKEATIITLRNEMQTRKEAYDAEVLKLSSMNEQVSKDNSELVEKGREATESLKVALQQLTDEKKAMQEQKGIVTGKEARELEASLERAKKERETFRQRCEKSEILQRNLQDEIASLRNQLKEKEEENKSLLQKNEIVTTAKKHVSEASNSAGEDDSLAETGLKSAQSRILQLKKYVHILEERVKEKEETVLSLRHENTRSNDVAMEKSLELSRTRRILERKIERLVKENSEWKRQFLIPNGGSRNLRSEQVDPTKNRQQNQQEQQQQQQQQQLRGSEKTVQTKGLRVADKYRRRSNPERTAIQTTLKQFNNGVVSKGVEEQQQPDNSNTNSADADSTTNDRVSNEKYLTKETQESVFTPVEVRALDVAPRRRIGGKFIRASSKRHSADLGKLMSRQEPAIGRKSDSDLLHRDEPVTIFVNKYRKKSEEEEHWV